MELYNNRIEGGTEMKENVQVKVVAIKKGMPKREIEKLLNAISAAWSDTHSGETLYCIPLEMEDEPEEKRGIIPFKK